MIFLMLFPFLIIIEWNLEVYHNCMSLWNNYGNNMMKLQNESPKKKSMSPKTSWWSWNYSLGVGSTGIDVCELGSFGYGLSKWETADVILKLSSEWRPNHGNIGFIIIQVSSVISFEHFIRKSMSILPSTSHGADCQQTNKYDHDATRNHHEYQFFKRFSPFSDFYYMARLILSIK